MIIVGLDISSVVFAAVVTQKKKFSVTVRPLSKAHDLGAHECYSEMMTLFADFRGQEVYVFMEAPIMGVGGPGATIPQAHCQGGAMAAAREKGFMVTQVNNQSAKKRVCGKGNINKDQVAFEMARVWPELIPEAKKWRTFTAGGKETGYRQDVIDAGMINRFGQHSVILRAKIARHRGK